MHELEQLKHVIEEVRKELDASIFSDSFEIYYEKSRRLDKLIEQYFELHAGGNG